MVLEVVVGEFVGQPEFRECGPVTAATVDAQRGSPPVAALAFVVARLDEAADLELAILDVSGIGSAGTTAAFSYAVWMMSR
ncbi:hypothetical protein ACH5A3_40760 [Streptomyces echinatus]|uniref:hypothetical protein n=1 Tax=Streptomyces echinatus TaxID=67293 RepID=UPI0037956144